MAPEVQQGPTSSIRACKRHSVTIPVVLSYLQVAWLQQEGKRTGYRGKCNRSSLSLLRARTYFTWQMQCVHCAPINQPNLSEGCPVSRSLRWRRQARWKRTCPLLISRLQLDALQRPASQRSAQLLRHRAGELARARDGMQDSIAKARQHHKTACQQVGARSK